MDALAECVRFPPYSALEMDATMKPRLLAARLRDGADVDDHGVAAVVGWDGSIALPPIRPLP